MRSQNGQLGMAELYYDAESGQEQPAVWMAAVFKSRDANALPALQRQAAWITHGCQGQGVEELIARLLANDLRGLERRARSAW